MIYTEMTKNAANLIFEDCRDIMDSAGLPLIFRITSVANQMDTELETVVALLSGMVEAVPSWRLLPKTALLELLEEAGFPPEVGEAVWLLKPKPGVSHDEHLLAIAHSGNAAARHVKLVEVVDGYNEMSLRTTNNSDPVRETYAQAANILRGAQ